MKGKGNYESIIEYVKANENSFPKLGLLLVNGELKITKTSLKSAVENSKIILLFN
jgi:hypothetical protein